MSKENILFNNNNNNNNVDTPYLKGSNTKAKHGGVISFCARESDISNGKTGITQAGQLCSPVREEIEDVEDDEFTGDLDEMDKKFSKDSIPESMGAPIRRQTLAPSEGLDERRSRVTGKSSSFSHRRSNLHGTSSSRQDDNVEKKLTRRVSFGGTSSRGSKSNEVGSVNELKEMLTKREKLDHTRQHRLNGMDIKLKETQSKLSHLQHKFTKQKEENEELKRQVQDLKKKNKALLQSKRRLEQIKAKHESTIKSLQSQSGVAKRQRTNDIKTSKIKKDEDNDEEFSDATDFLSSSSSMPTQQNQPRRYTMAPGEVSRIRGANSMNGGEKVTESHFIRIDGLEKGTNSHKLLAMCQIYGDIAQLRVTSDVVSGVLKGYVTFLDPSFAKAAVKGLKAKGYKAFLVSGN